MPQPPAKPPAAPAPPYLSEPTHWEEGEFAGEDVAIDQWLPVPVSDSADYLDRPAVQYAEGEAPAAPEGGTE
jgi:hypothetical protein